MYDPIRLMSCQDCAAEITQGIPLPLSHGGERVPQLVAFGDTEGKWMGEPCVEMLIGSSTRLNKKSRGREVKSLVACLMTKEALAVWQDENANI